MAPSSPNPTSLILFIYPQDDIFNHIALQYDKIVHIFCHFISSLLLSSNHIINKIKSIDLYRVIPILTSYYSILDLHNMFQLNTFYFFQTLHKTRVVMDPGTYKNVASSYIASKRKSTRRPHTHQSCKNGDLVCDTRPTSKVRFLP